MDLAKEVAKVKDKQDFVDFIEILIKDLKENSNEWENKSLESFLEAMANWIEDMEGYYHNNNLPIPENINWNVFANVLIAAKMYE
ncbi:MAG: hypothetical protein LBS20_03975 [Prevotella sp.]|jgi:hypothetical protein|nr:hypothetical protein [Prevotella sp.]